MKALRKYLTLFVFIFLCTVSCKKDINTNPSPAAPYMTASCNNTFVAFTGTVKVASSQYTINGTSSGNATIQLSFNTVGTGICKLGFGQALFSSPNGESWETTNSDTGSVSITAITSNSITGGFNFYASETRPTLGASTLTVNSGSFYLTW